MKDRRAIIAESQPALKVSFNRPRPRVLHWCSEYVIPKEGPGVVINGPFIKNLLHNHFITKK